MQKPTFSTVCVWLSHSVSFLSCHAGQAWRWELRERRGWVPAFPLNTEPSALLSRRLGPQGPPQEVATSTGTSGQKMACNMSSLLGLGPALCTVSPPPGSLDHSAVPGSAGGHGASFQLGPIKCIARSHHPAKQVHWPHHRDNSRCPGFCVALWRGKHRDSSTHEWGLRVRPPWGDPGPTCCVSLGRFYNLSVPVSLCCQALASQHHREDQASWYQCRVLRVAGLKPAALTLC